MFFTLLPAKKPKSQQNNVDQNFLQVNDTLNTPNRESLYLKALPIEKTTFFDLTGKLAVLKEPRSFTKCRKFVIYHSPR